MCVEIDEQRYGKQSDPAGAAEGAATMLANEEATLASFNALPSVSIPPYQMRDLPAAFSLLTSSRYDSGDQ